MSRNKSNFDSVFIWGIILMLCISTYTMFEFLILFKEEQRIYNQENKCVQLLVARGIERKYIATGGGTCWSVKPEY